MTRKERSRNPEKPLKSARRPACGNVDNAKGVAHSPTGEQKQKQRTFDVLPKPANLIRYRQFMALWMSAEAVSLPPVGQRGLMKLLAGRPASSV
jgi:hypothetical protein